MKALLIVLNERTYLVVGMQMALKRNDNDLRHYNPVLVS